MIRSLVTMLLLLAVQVTVGQYTNTEVVAKIKLSALDDVITLKATATNQTEVYKSLTYTFSAFRTDANNNKTKTDQDGRFTLEANESKELSVTTVNAKETDQIIILLLVFDEDQIIAKDRVSFNEKTKNKKESVEEEQDDGIELKGIVVEETKTKPGRDFYDYFYTAYTLNQINGSKVVGVFEKLSFGRTTIIQVKIEDAVIHEFIGKPDLEYLEQMSKIAIRKVFKYFKDLKKQKNDIFQY